MRAFKDDRGRAYNDIFPAIGKGDVNVGVLYPGTIKAFHRHQKQDDYWFCIKGNLRAILASPGTPVPLSAWVPEYSSFAGINIVNAEGQALEAQYREQVQCGTVWIEIKNESNTAGWRVRYIRAMQTAPMIAKEHYLSEGDILHIPAGVWHGVQALGASESIMIYHITNKYNPEHPDEERAPWNAFHSWETSRK